MAIRTDLDGSRLDNVTLGRGIKSLIFYNAAITDNYPLSADMPRTIVLTAPSPMDVLMPPDATTPAGTELEIINSGAVAGATLTLKTSADAALTPAVAVTIDNSVTMVFLGGTGLLGWRRKNSL